MIDQGHLVSFDSNEAFILKNGILICSAKQENNLYVIRPTDTKAILNHELFKIVETQRKRQRTSPKENTYLWHLRLGHINPNRIERLVKSEILNELEDNSLPPCESCLAGKMTKSPFIGKGYLAKEPLELIHSDLCGSMNVKARGGFEYFISFIDDYSRYGYIYLMHHKSDALEKFKEYKAEGKNLIGKTIKTLRFDHGGEYVDLRFQDYMIEHGIQSQLSAPGTPHQNGVSERRNRTLLDMVRSMMSYAQLPSSFWGYAMLTTAHILNNVPSKSVSETPSELWGGRKPSMRSFRIWGCPAHVLVTNPKKLEPRSRLCQFVGYTRNERWSFLRSTRKQSICINKCDFLGGRLYEKP